MHNIVFHYSIRFKVNKGLSGAPFSLFMRQNFDSQASIVASIPLRRNNSMKIWPKYLEIAKTRRTFASTKQSQSFFFIRYKLVLVFQVSNDVCRACSDAGPTCVIWVVVNDRCTNNFVEIQFFTSTRQCGTAAVRHLEYRMLGSEASMYILNYYILQYIIIIY